MKPFGVLCFRLVVLLLALNAPFPLVAQEAERPQAEPPTTLQRLEGDVEQEGVINEETRLYVGIVIALVALTLIVSLIVAFRRGRRELPEKKRREPPRNIED